MKENSKVGLLMTEIIRAYTWIPCFIYGNHVGGVDKNGKCNTCGEIVKND